jgi:Sulfotransferase family
MPQREGCGTQTGTRGRARGEGVTLGASTGLVDSIPSESPLGLASLLVQHKVFNQFRQGTFENSTCAMDYNQRRGVHSFRQRYNSKLGPFSSLTTAEIVSVFAAIAGVACVSWGLSTSNTLFSPNEELIVKGHGGRHQFSIGDRVPLVDFLAAEVRRAKHGRRRVPHDPVVSLSDADVRRRHWKLRSDGAASGDVSGSDSVDAARLAAITPVDHQYWQRKDVDQYSSMAIERSLLVASVMRRLLVLRKHRAVFCPVLGVASGALVDFLEQAEGVGHGSLPTLADFSLRDRERFLTSDTVFRFVFVRHPFMRAAAAYNKGISSGDLDSEGYRSFMGIVRGRPLGEQERELQRLSMLFFLTFLGKQDPAHLDDRFAPQTQLCGIGLVDYHFIGRLETLGIDIVTAARSLNIDSPMLRKSASDKRINTTKTAIETFAVSKHRSKAAKLYAADLTALNYPASL